MERATYYSKSFVIALALVLRKITAEQAAQASHVEVNSQIEKWGEVEDCTFLSAYSLRNDNQYFVQRTMSTTTICAGSLAARPVCCPP